MWIWMSCVFDRIQEVCGVHVCATPRMSSWRHAKNLSCWSLDPVNVQTSGFKKLANIALSVSQIWSIAHDTTPSCILKLGCQDWIFKMIKMMLSMLQLKFSWFWAGLCSAIELKHSTVTPSVSLRKGVLLQSAAGLGLGLEQNHRQCQWCCPKQNMAWNGCIQREAWAEPCQWNGMHVSAAWLDKDATLDQHKAKKIWQSDHCKRWANKSGRAFFCCQLNLNSPPVVAICGKDAWSLCNLHSLSHWSKLQNPYHDRYLVLNVDGKWCCFVPNSLIGRALERGKPLVLDCWSEKEDGGQTLECYLLVQ